MRTISIELGTVVTDPHMPKRILALGFEFVTESIAIVARKGAGKTYTARCMVEDMLDGGAQVVVIDPLDVWWGLRLSADGKHEGRNVIILGGTHADLPLVETAGAAIADLVVDRTLSVVLVLDHLSMAAQRRFVADFAERLFERKSTIEHRSALHLVIDEADAFAPQRVMPDMARCAGAIDRIVRRGRTRGLGATVITQRPAVLNKDVLTQTELLICLQVVAPQDRAALTEWVRANGDEAQAKRFLDSLASLQRGEAWAWSPAKLRALERIQIRKAHTFDSSDTPRVGDKRIDPPKLTPTDLRAIEQDLATVIEQAKANDPVELRRQVAELKRQIAGRAPAGPAPGELERAVTRSLKARDGEWMKHLDKARARILEQVHQLVTETLGGVLVDVHASTAAPLIEREVVQDRAPRVFANAAAHEHEPQTSVSARRTPPPLEAHTTGANGGLSKAQRLILSVLAHEPHGAAREDVAVRTLYAHDGGGFQNALSALRTDGYIQGTLGDPAVIKITSEGRDALGVPAALPGPAELRQQWGAKLGKACRLILETLGEAINATMTKEAIAAETNYEPTGGGFQNALSRCRALRLIHGREQVVLHEALVG